ncbi:phage terminase small subunit P27 family [Fructobacillus fructosus]|uniref:phage terminase small subunit P27 family n=1 Tax=Fructobacillus fructosus TaxID=1631 RepID=UPI0016588E5A|nr:phage terminase small subunit P27 family [Fructobacillus fructosus]MBC9118642.1 phage terminase small subunit P27 family [Fructobacillus fructosus]MBD9365306.1 phage terminase small subunit P27 family [Leuconostoc mesenteroides]
MANNNLSASPPDYLGGTARYLWRRIVPILIEQYSVQKLDRTIVESLCINYQIMRLSYESIKEHGTQYVTDNGLIKSNPAVSDIDKATKNLRSACDSLGMTPTARAELLSITVDDDETDQAGIAEMLKAFSDS